jgi:hypothetical protein
MARQFREQLEEEASLEPTSRRPAAATRTPAPAPAAAPVAPAPVAPTAAGDTPPTHTGTPATSEADENTRHNDYPGAEYTPLDVPDATPPAPASESMNVTEPAAGNHEQRGI